MILKDFLKGTLRIALAIFLALAALAAATVVYFQVKESRERDAATPYEEVRDWSFDLKDRLGMAVTAKTKLVSGRLMVAIDVDGYPKYLEDPRNRNGSLIFEFLDKDGFKVVTHSVNVSEFSTMIGKAGENIGLQHQYDEYLDLDRYRSLARMQVGWTLLTDSAAESPSPPSPKPTLDHCAPNLSRPERLKRLAQYGTVREAGAGEYTAGGRSVTFFTYDNSLISCR